jgi:hypothetical protein
LLKIYIKDSRKEQNNYTKAWQEIINEGFREAEKTIESSLDEKENIIKPVKPPKPARTVSKARGRYSLT